MSDSAERLYQTLCENVRQIALLSSTEQLLGWDERTMLPSAGAEHRAEQMTLLAGIIHARWTDPELGRRLADLTESPLAADEHSDTGATIRRVKRQYDKCVKLPQKLVEELTRVSVLAQQAWESARANDDYAAFRPWLQKTLELKRQEAESLGYPEHPYDALLDEYEPDERTANVGAALSQLREQLVPLVAEIRESGRQPDASILQQSFPIAEQESFAREAATGIGFNFNRGRLDVTAHPFCSSPGPNDCRITSRYNERAFGDAFFSVLHEAGHGMYEQGLPADQYGLPLGEAVSLGIHESQSRLWENMVGRSRPFWEHFFPEAQRRFPHALGHVSLDDFHFAVNDVRPSLIRVEADEATYNLHILIRFELEQALLNDDLSADDLPGAWNESYQRCLGIKPSDDANGVLQDIHWAAGLVGYFPTYSLGNLYAAQLFAQAEADLGGLAGPFAQGEFQPLLDWLRENVHRHGQRYSAAELVHRITGRELSHTPLMEHLRAKLGPLYGLA
jgi:carboxypeptidase Taq